MEPGGRSRLPGLVLNHRCQLPQGVQTVEGELEIIFLVTHCLSAPGSGPLGRGLWIGRQDLCDESFRVTATSTGKKMENSQLNQLLQIHMLMSPHMNHSPKQKADPEESCFTWFSDLSLTNFNLKGSRRQKRVLTVARAPQSKYCLCIISSESSLNKQRNSSLAGNRSEIWIPFMA